MTAAMPTVFFGHANPMRAVEENSYAGGWRAMAAPRTFYEVGGIPRALDEVQYAALARRVRELVAQTPDHDIPLLYGRALARDGEAPSFPVEGFDGGSVLMPTVRYGGAHQSERST